MNWVATTCGAAIWIACGLAADYNVVPSWLGIPLVLAAAWFTIHYGVSRRRTRRNAK